MPKFEVGKPIEFQNDATIPSVNYARMHCPWEEGKEQQKGGYCRVAYIPKIVAVDSVATRSLERNVP